MILRTILKLLIVYGASCYTEEKCPTGDMTDVQSWVDGDGNIIASDSQIFINTLDVSNDPNPMALLKDFMSANASEEPWEPIIYLTMANCRLRSVPPVFDTIDSNGQHIASTVRYITFYGNFFQDYVRSTEEYDATINATDVTEDNFEDIYGDAVEAAWPVGFKNRTFLELRELDLRRCSIQTLGNDIFNGMPNLEALYISGNNIYYISSGAFNGLNNLMHLDLSRNIEVRDNNEESTLQWEFEEDSDLKLVSLDMSYTRISWSTLQVLMSFGNRFQRLTLCYSGMKELKNNFLNSTSLKILDVSGNHGVLAQKTALAGLENSLQVLYAENIGQVKFETFKGFRNLRILKLTNNQIADIDPEVCKSLEKLEVLFLDNNRINTWFDTQFGLIPNLKVLSLRNNNINIIRSEMIRDISKVKYVGLGYNHIICNCHARDLFNIALVNELNETPEPTRPLTVYDHIESEILLDYHHFEDIINNRPRINESMRRINIDYLDQEVTGHFVLYDYEDKAYLCEVAHNGQIILIMEEKQCRTRKEVSYEDVIMKSWNKLILILLVPGVLAVVFMVGYYYRRSIKYFYITLRNSAMLSLISDGKEINEDTIFNYDVFVSYCHEDRKWVLDELLPQVERDCNVSVCLHERDFQVGLSILENIVACMDRSRSIALVISQRFLLSQWCQFEMHLAQHRLLETRREDLILILLEDIPRRQRPNTLHYLMLSKTYVQWPSDTGERPLFWRRLKKCLATQRLRSVENVSLA